MAKVRLRLWDFKKKSRYSPTFRERTDSFSRRQPEFMKSQHLRISTNKNKNVVGKKVTIPHQRVILLRADINYTEIILDDGESIIVSQTLKAFEARFAEDENFVRTHKSFVVNMAHVVSFHPNDGMTIKLANNEVATLARRRKAAFLTHYRQMLG